MGRAPCCDKSKVKKGPWSPEEDATLKNYIHNHGVGGNWIALPTKAGLTRCGKSCRLRWLNYLRPDIKHGGFTHEEDNIIYTLYSKLGSRWSVIASHLAGRTDNDVKNYWNTKLKKKLVAAVSETNFNETNLKIPTTTNLDFQNPTPSMPILVPETESKFPPNSNVLPLLNQISPSLVTSYALNSYTHNLNHATSSSQEGNICGFSSDTVENNMYYGINTGVGDLGFSESFGMEFSHGLNSGIGEFGNYYPNLGNSFYHSVTNQY